MKRKIKLIGTFVIPLLLIFFVLNVSAHSGGTDGAGGHYDHDTGEYHYHHGYSAHDHYDMDGDGVLDCPYEYTDNTEPEDNYNCDYEYDYDYSEEDSAEDIIDFSKYDFTVPDIDWDALKQNTVHGSYSDYQYSGTYNTASENEDDASNESSISENIITTVIAIIYISLWILPGLLRKK